MPGPLGPPAVLLLAGPGAVATAKHLAYRAATSPSVTSATVTAVLFYWAFQKLPEWVKDDISFKNLLENNEELSKEEFVGLFSVVEKLHNVASNIQELDTDIPQLHAAMLAFIQLSGQMKLQQQLDYHQSKEERKGETTVNDDSCNSPVSTTITRDSLYESAGNAVDMSILRSNEIQNALQLATFAYYTDFEVC